MTPNEHSALKPSSTTGFFAALSGVRCLRGTAAPKARRAGGWALIPLLVLAAACAALALSAAPASAALPTEFGSEGSAAGQFVAPIGVAVNQATGDVYVIDHGNNRVDEFSGEGVFIRAWGWGVIPEAGKPPKEEAQVCTTVTGCQRGSTGSGPGQFEFPGAIGGIAVDNDPLDFGSVYVVDSRNGRIEKFSSEGHFELQIPTGTQAVAVGPTGILYVGESGAVQQYTPEGEKLGGPLALEGAGTITDLAITETGELYLTEAPQSEGNQSGTYPARHYSAAGEPVGELPECAGEAGKFDCEIEGSARAVTLNAAGEVFIGQRLATSGRQQFRGFSPAGVQLTAFGTSSAGNEGQGLAFNDVTGALYAVSPGVHVFVPALPGPKVSEESAGSIEPTAALVHAVIEPDAPAACGETHYLVEYGTTAGYGNGAPVVEGLLPASFNRDPVEVPLSGLSTRTEYHYRFVASDECEEGGVEVKHTTDGEDEKFTTQPPALIEEEWATNVRSTSATLHAKINPLGSATEYRFVYGPTAACGGAECSVPVPAEQLGSGKASVEVEQHLQGLTAGQAYHYRVITTNTIAGKQETEEGEERVFTTQTGGEAGLPDSRQWELVSPPDKHGASLLGTSSQDFVQAAAGGGGVVYLATAPTERQPQGNGAIMQILARRGGSAWSSLDLEVPHTFPLGVAEQVPYVAFSSDLGLGVLQTLGSFELALSSEATEQTPYLRDTTTGLFTPLVIGCRPSGECPANRNDTTEPFIPFGEEAGEGQCTEVECGPRFNGASPDLSHVVLGLGINHRVASLLQGAPDGSLYEWAGGKLALISELPKENPPAVEEYPEHAPELGVGAFRAHAISNDGSRIFWSQKSAAGSNPNLLFMRDMTRGETIEIGTAAGAGFEGANATGTLVFYSGKECEIPLESPKLECRILDEEGTTEPLDDGRLLANSEDGSWVYFRQGENIYVRHGREAASLVASNVGNIGPNDQGPQEDPWRASPDGQWFSFMSAGPLTSYDNHDALTGRPDEEVYLYSAGSASHPPRLVCASCDPTGQRPQGRTPQNLNFAVYATADWGEQSLAATIPGWAPFSSRHVVYDPRFLSDSGRLFFNAVGGLVPRDVNGQVDAYELEPPGVGGCTTGTQTGTVVYSPAAAGCVALISNGESGEESVFEDASVSGEDVFFLSSSRLSTADQDGTLSMWDAHTCTTASPCIPPPASPAPPCNTESSCKASQSPQPQIYGAPSSATFSGPGNATPTPPAKPKPPSTAEVRAKHLKSALALCKRRYPHSKKKRQSCEKAAHKAYGARASARKSATAKNANDQRRTSK